MRKEWSLFTNFGERKYLSRQEIDKFIECSAKFDKLTSSFCWVMAATGCRISEGLSLTIKNIDKHNMTIVIECKKKRGKKIFRAIPVPSSLIGTIYGLYNSGVLGSDRLWNWSRMTAYRKICQVMEKAGISGGHATPKGLRHGFAVSAIQANIPLNIVQRWLGHADIKTTSIYANAVGPEERQLAARVWRQMKKVSGARGNFDEVAGGIQENGMDSSSYSVGRSAGPGSDVPLWRGSTGGQPGLIQSGCAMLQNWLYCNQNNPSISYTYPSSYGFKNYLFSGDAAEQSRNIDGSEDDRPRTANMMSD